MIVGGRAATAGGKSNDLRTGGALMNAVKMARVEKRWSWETRSSLDGCM
jgi:hypothetical protein